MRDPNPLLRRIKLSDLRLFSAVVGAGGMAKAATQLHISQPAVSKAIASLEQTLGVRLLDRHAGGVTPTIYGDALLQGSTAAFDDLGQSVGRIEFLNDPRKGKLRFACGQPVALGFVPGIVEKMSADYPGVRFEVFDFNGIEALKRRQVELAMTRGLDFEDADIHEEALFEDPLVVYAAADSPWAQRRKMSLADLIDAPWILVFYNSPGGPIDRGGLQGKRLRAAQGSRQNLQDRCCSRSAGNGPVRQHWPAFHVEDVRETIVTQDPADQVAA